MPEWLCIVAMLLMYAAGVLTGWNLAYASAWRYVRKIGTEVIAGRRALDGEKR